jgi:acetolactate synthase-1/2/3 large subunit
MKAAELFVKRLENEGVDYIFGIPGEENINTFMAKGVMPFRRRSWC